MSNTKSKPGTRNKTRKAYKWIGHIEVHFNDDERRAVVEYCDERTFDFEDAIASITQAKIGVKFSYGESDDAYRITLQPKATDAYLRGYTLGFNHLSLDRLLQIALYVVNVLIEHEGIEIPNSTPINDW